MVWTGIYFQYGKADTIQKIAEITHPEWVNILCGMQIVKIHDLTTQLQFF